MADEEHLKTLQQGVGAWNRWRKANDVEPDLSGADLSGAMLEFADLCNADLRGANLESAQLTGAWLAHAQFEDCKPPDAMNECNLFCADLSGLDLSGVDLSGSHLDEGSLRGADLSRADLTSATLGSTRLQGANLEGAKLIGAHLSNTELEGAELRLCDLSLANLVETEMEGAKLADAIFDRTVLAKVDLSAAEGLSDAYHEGPSTIGTDTIECTLAGARGDAKRRQDCVDFFRGAGIAEHLLQHYRYLGGPLQPYVRTHIVYERSDKDFARRLHDELQAWGVRCWLEERDSRTDEWSVVVNRIDWLRAKVILCASAAAMKGKWAPNVIAAAVREVKIGRDFLVVVDLDGCLREGRGGDHAEWIRSRVAVDFSRPEGGRSGLEVAMGRISERLLAR